MSDFKNKLEIWVAGMLKKIDKYARPSKASGASTESYDIQTEIPLAIECKINRTNLNPVIRMITWDKLLNEIPMRSKRTPVLFIQNTHGKRFAVLDAEDFFNDFLYEMYESEEK